MDNSSINTLAGLILSLQTISDHVDPETRVRINGDDGARGVV